LQSSGSELDLNIQSTDPWTGNTGNGNYNATLNWQGGVVPNSNQTVTAAVLPNITSGQFNITMSTPVTLSNISIDTSTVGYKLFGSAITLDSGNTAQAGVIYVAGSQAHTINNALTLASPSTLISIGAPASLTLANTLTATGAVIQIGTGTLFIRQANQLQNASFTETQGTTDLGGLNASIGNLVTNAGSTMNLGTGGGLSFGALSANTVLAGSIVGTGSVTKNGTGTTTITGTNSFVGPVILNGGMLVVQETNALGLGAAGNNVTFSGNATIQQNGTGQRGVTGSPVKTFIGSRAISVNSNVTATFDTHDNNLSFPGVVSGLGTFAKTGSGTLTVTGANTIAGKNKKHKKKKNERE